MPGNFTRQDAASQSVNALEIRETLNEIMTIRRKMALDRDPVTDFHKWVAVVIAVLALLATVGQYAINYGQVSTNSRDIQELDMKVDELRKFMWRTEIRK